MRTVHRIILGAGLLGLLSFSAGAQTPQEKALEIGRQGVKLMDEGKIDESLKLLAEAQKLDPGNVHYPYEQAYAYYIRKDYKEAAKRLDALVKHPDVNDHVYQLLGNCYDFLGKPTKAIDTYQAGLKKFPTSGKLFLETGNVWLNKQEYLKALEQYEQGIRHDPAFPSNYFRATKIYLSSSESVWGMMYGEMFMNLERNTARTAEISAALFDAYKTHIKFPTDTSVTVSFSKRSVINMSPEAMKDPSKFRLPFPMGLYEPGIAVGLGTARTIDLPTLNQVRTGLLTFYNSGGMSERYHPNVLFDYQNELREAGHLEAYNYWLLMKGDEAAFTSWQKANEPKWTAFVEWFTAHRLQLDATHYFVSEQ